MLRITGPPLPPTNLVVTPLGYTNDGRYVVRLEWSPPLDDGGASVTSYQIFVDNSIRESATTAITSIELNSTSREHLVEVRAVNCAGYSTNVSSNFSAATPAIESMMLPILYNTWNHE